jgi:DNA repair exonuclease SbcCD nuclease subunit
VHADDVSNNDRYRRGLSLVLSDMLSHNPDLVLIAGDLFDSNRASHETIEWTMNELSAVPRPVVMIPGNHDCLEAEAIYRRYDFGALDNVTTLLDEAGELVRFDELDVAVWGRGMVDHHPGYLPLENCPERPADTRWYIALGHGIFVPRGETTHRSSPVRMEDIDASPCDYIALGHHHAARDVSGETTPAAYCGSPTDATGSGETYAIIDLVTGTPARLEFHNLSN